MKETDIEMPDISLVRSVKTGIRAVAGSAKALARGLAAPALLTAAAVTATICGETGEVKVDPNLYVPYHELSWLYIAKYVGGTALSLLFFMLWRGCAFLLLPSPGKAEAASGGKPFRASDFLYSGLRFVQFCMLASFVFGLPGAALVYLCVTVSAWFWTVAAIYMAFVSVPLYISLYEYMTADTNFRGALKKAFRYTTVQWGRIFLRLLLVNAAAAAFILLFAAPAAALASGVYDNAVAVAVNGSSPTPAMVYVLECAAAFIGTLLSLLVLLAATSVLMRFFDDAGKYADYLAKARAESRQDKQTPLF